MQKKKNHAMQFSRFFHIVSQLKSINDENYRPLLFLRGKRGIFCKCSIVFFPHCDMKVVPHLSAIGVSIRTEKNVISVRFNVLF